MKKIAVIILLLFANICVLSSFAQGRKAANAASTPKPKVVKIDVAGEAYVPILNGPPESMGMESGFVVLAPGKDVGKHDPKQYEEVLIVLSGTGEMVLEDGSRLALSQNSVLYCPPHQQHNVINTGTTALKYIYVAARTQMN